jgi:hypothetical protein
VSTREIVDIKPVTVDMKQLLLDPNNPRFISVPEEYIEVPEDGIEKAQPATLARFTKSTSRGSEEADATNVADLYDSMKLIGYVGIDRIVVRHVAGGDKYLVIEGNRRVATMQLLLRELAPGSGMRPSDRRKLEAHRGSFEQLSVMCLETAGLTREEIKRQVSVILGLRHHGALLEWGALPRAYSIYKEYTREEPPTPRFELDNRKISEVAARLSVSADKVRRSLRAYIPYLQLRDEFRGVRDRHFSLIQDGVTNRYIAGTGAGSYLTYDGNTYRLDADSLSRLDRVCQFEARDDLPSGKKKILQDPKSWGPLGRLVDKLQSAEREGDRLFISGLIRQVEDEDDVNMTLDQATDKLTAHLRAKKWIEELVWMLDRQSRELPFDKYDGGGNDRGNKDEIKPKLDELRAILGL